MVHIEGLNLNALVLQDHTLLDLNYLNLRSCGGRPIVLNANANIERESLAQAVAAA